MWTPIDIDTDGVLGMECRGKLSSEEFEQMQSWAERELARLDRPALVVFLGGFEGYEDMSALWADLQVDTQLTGKFSRIAIVADANWLKWSAKAADVVSRADLKWFETGDRAGAVAWAAGAA